MEAIIDRGCTYLKNLAKQTWIVSFDLVSFFPLSRSLSFARSLVPSQRYKSRRCHPQLAMVRAAACARCPVMCAMTCQCVRIFFLIKSHLPWLVLLRICYQETWAQASCIYRSRDRRRQKRCEMCVDTRASSSQSFSVETFESRS